MIANIFHVGSDARMLDLVAPPVVLQAGSWGWILLTEAERGLRAVARRNRTSTPHREASRE